MCHCACVCPLSLPEHVCATESPESRACSLSCHCHHDGLFGTCSRCQQLPVALQETGRVQHARQQLGGWGPACALHTFAWLQMAGVLTIKPDPAEPHVCGCKCVFMGWARGLSLHLGREARSSAVVKSFWGEPSVPNSLRDSAGNPDAGCAHSGNTGGRRS